MVINHAKTGGSVIHTARKLRRWTRAIHQYVANHTLSLGLIFNNLAKVWKEIDRVKTKIRHSDGMLLRQQAASCCILYPYIFCITLHISPSDSPKYLAKLLRNVSFMPRQILACERCQISYRTVLQYSWVMSYQILAWDHLRSFDDRRLGFAPVIYS